jgi:hypothetical protein
MPGKRSYRKDKIRKHKSKLLHRNKQSGGDPLGDQSIGSPTIPPSVGLPTGLPIVPTTAETTASTTAETTPVTTAETTPVTTAETTGLSSVPSTIPSNGNNPTMSMQYTVPTTSNNNQLETSKVEPKIPPDSIEGILSALVEYTQHINGETTVKNGGVDVNPYHRYPDDLEYENKMAPSFGNGNHLYDDLLPRPPCYSLRTYQIMSIHIRDMPNHQKDFLKNALESKGISKDKMNELERVWVIYYHPRFQGLVFGKHIVEENTLSNIRIDNAESFFGNSYAYGPSATLMYGVYNSRVKVIKFEDLPLYQQQWLDKYIKAQKKYYQSNNSAKAFVGCFEETSSSSGGMPWFHYHQDSNKNVPYAPVSQADGTPVSSNNAQNTPNAPINNSRNVNDSQNTVNDLNGVNIMFLDWDPKQVAIMPLSPAQVLYPFDSIDNIRGSIEQKMINNQKMEGNKVKSNDGQRTAEGVHPNATEILQQFQKSQANAGSGVAPSPLSMPYQQ